MERIEFYGYSINLKKCKIMRYKCTGIQMSENLYKTKFYYADTGKYTGSQKLVDINNFEVVKSYQIVSFNDDYAKYRQILFNTYAEMLEKNKANVQKQEQFLEKLKSQS